MRHALKQEKSVEREIKTTSINSVWAGMHLKCLKTSRKLKIKENLYKRDRILIFSDLN
jgi:hypothetical protein